MINSAFFTRACFALSFAGLALFCAAISPSAGAVAIHGWENAAFGITQEELRRRLGTQAVELASGAERASPMYAPFEIRNRRFLGAVFNVKFKFSPSTGKLIGIDLFGVDAGAGPPDDKAERDACVKVRSGLEGMLGIKGSDSAFNGLRGSFATSERKTTFEADNAWIRWTSLGVAAPAAKDGLATHTCLVSYYLKKAAQ